jgi:hypothetical protein
VAYDRADWHYDGDYPPGLPSEAGGTHIGMFIAWAIITGLEGELHKEESADAFQAVRERRITGREFLFSRCDQKFTDEDLNEEGSAFARWYYSGYGPYIDDYEKTLAVNVPSTYHVKDTWENFDKLKPVIDRRFEAWRRSMERRHLASPDMKRTLLRAAIAGAGGVIGAGFASVFVTGSVLGRYSTVDAIRDWIILSVGAIVGAVLFSWASKR